MKKTGIVFNLIAMATDPIPTHPELMALLPSVLAAPLREYEEEAHPVVKLLRLCEFGESVYRLSFFLAYAQARKYAEEQCSPPVLSQEFINLISRCIYTPAFGHWALLANEAVKQPGVCDQVRLMIDGLDAAFPKAGVKDGNIIELRNLIAHKYLSKDQGYELLREWEGRLEVLLGLCAWMTSLELIARDGEGMFWRLQGDMSRLSDAEAKDFPLDNNQVAARLGGDRREIWLLWPLLKCLLVKQSNQTAVPDAQVYCRSEKEKLDYISFTQPQTIPSRDGFDLFLEWFTPADAGGLVLSPGSRETMHYMDQWIRQSTAACVGRHTELAAIRSGAVFKDKAIHFLSGRPGMGKSVLMGVYAGEQLASEETALVIPYRFKNGSKFCTPDHFLEYAINRLGAWKKELAAPEEGDAWNRLTKALALLPKNDARVLLILDGLDEIDSLYPDFVGRVHKRLSLAGVCLVCSGRPQIEDKLPEATMLFPKSPESDNGLPPMNAGDIRQWLMDRCSRRDTTRDLILADEIYQIIGRPEESFFSVVAERSDGLPLYVTFVLQDLMSGKKRPLEPSALPKGLTAYYREMIDAFGVGDLGVLRSAVVQLLAVAKTELSTGDMRELLPLGTTLENIDAAKLEEALSSIIALLSVKRDDSGQVRYSIYHHTLREELLLEEGTKGWANTLAKAAAAYDPANPAAYPAYLYGRGISHLIDANRHEEAASYLMNFSYLMDRLKATGGLTDDVTDLFGDLDKLFREISHFHGNYEVRLWIAFFRVNRYLLTHANADWPAYKILLQLAAEHADKSPITQAAGAWLEQEPCPCDWGWVVNTSRANHDGYGNCDVMIKDDGGVIKTFILCDDETKILTVSSDETLRIWDIATGELVHRLKEHTSKIHGALLCAKNSRILTWDLVANTFCVWDVATGKSLGVQKGFPIQFRQPLFFADGERVLAHQIDSGTLHVWNVITGECFCALKEDSGYLRGAQIFADETRVLSWSSENKLYIWDITTGKSLYTLTGHHKPVEEALIFSDDVRILSWARDHTLRIWDSLTGKILHTFEIHEGDIIHACIGADDAYVFAWTDRSEFQIWDAATGELLHVSYGYSLANDSMESISLNGKNRIVMEAEDHTLCEYDSATLEIMYKIKHDASIKYIVFFPDGRRVLTWSGSCIDIWELPVGKRVGTLQVGEIYTSGPYFQSPVLVSNDNTRIVSNRGDMLRIWTVPNDATEESFQPRKEETDDANNNLSYYDKWLIGPWATNDRLRKINDLIKKGIETWRKKWRFVHCMLLLAAGENHVSSWSWSTHLRTWRVVTEKYVHGCSSFVKIAYVLADDGNLKLKKLYADGTNRSWK